MTGLADDVTDMLRARRSVAWAQPTFERPREPWVVARSWPLCADSVGTSMQRIAAPLPDASNERALIIQPQLVREQRKCIGLTYYVRSSQVIAG